MLNVETGVRFDRAAIPPFPAKARRVALPQFLTRLLWRSGGTLG